MKNIYTLIAAVVLLCPSCRFITIKDGFLSCAGDVERITASGNYVTKSFETGDFSAVQAYACCDISFTQGETGVSVHTSDNIAEHLDISTDADGLLKIAPKDGYSFKNVKKLDIRLSSPTLNGLYIKGAADFKIEDGLVTDRLEVYVSGAGDISIDGLRAGDVRINISGAGDIDIDNLDCTSVSVEIKGAGDCELEGRADRADISIKGAGDVDISDLKAADVNTSVKGAGTVRRK